MPNIELTPLPCLKVGFFDQFTTSELTLRTLYQEQKVKAYEKN